MPGRPPRCPGLLAIGALVACVLVPAAAGAAPCATAVADPAAVLCELNAVRSAHARPPLDANRKLARAARRHAADMVERGFFAHESPDGRTLADRVRAAGYLGGRRPWRLGEILAWLAGERVTAADAVAAWAASPPHAKVLLSAAYEDAGVGVAAGTPTRAPGAESATLAVDFGAHR